MTTFSVSSASQLASAISSARGGDVIKLSSGNYGTLNITKKFSGNVTITSDSGNATFKGVTVRGAANVTLDHLKFEGSGSGYGVQVALSSNVKVSNSTFAKYTNAANFSRITGLTVDNNDFFSLKHDAMRFAGIANATISRNKYVESGSVAGYTHKDFIQFWTNKANGEGPSKNVKITGNEFYSKDGLTHGIFILNEAGSMGKHQNIDIQNNYLKSSHTHGITVAGANDVDIRSNVLIRDGKHYPVINVAPDCTYVAIVNNTAPSIPNKANSTWTISGNKETAGGNIWHWPNGGKAAPAKSASLAVADDDGAPSLKAGSMAAANPDGDEFRFTAKALATGTKTIDFDAGDLLVLTGFRSGTFRDFDGGNHVQHKADRSGVKIDSVADLKEIAAASPAVDVKVSKATGNLTLEIDQGAVTHRLVLEGVADEYFAL